MTARNAARRLEPSLTKGSPTPLPNSATFVDHGSTPMSSHSNRNKQIVLLAFDTLFNQRDYVAAERYWSPSYIQHSAHLEPGREGLFAEVKQSPPSLRYENSLAMADGELVMLHGRFSGTGRPANWIALDILRLEDGVLVEHWDVLQDEVTQEQSVSGLPMFGESFPQST